MRPELHIRDLGDGIAEIDCMFCRPRFAAVYLIHAGGEAAFIDCGTSHSVVLLLEALKTIGLSREQVRYVIPTHVHLDHAAGAGGLIENLPNAQLIVHPRGLRHMIDPGKLLASAVSVYGEEKFQRLFGNLIAVPATRALAVEDGFEIRLGDRVLRFLHTPGHAKHHICIYDSVSHGVFAGDTFGLAYPELDSSDGAFILPTSTPIQFDPRTWLKTLDRLTKLEPERMYMTHFGPVDEVDHLADNLRHDLIQYMEIGRQRVAASDRLDQIRERLMQYTLERLAQQGSRCPASRAQELLAMDIDLNAQGLEMWLDKRS